MENSTDSTDTSNGNVDDGNILAKVIGNKSGDSTAKDQQEKSEPSIPMPTVSDIIDFLKDNPESRLELKNGIRKELKLSGWKFRIFETYFDSYFGTTENAGNSETTSSNTAAGKKTKYKSLDEHLEIEDYWTLAELAYNHRAAGHTIVWIAEAMDINPAKVKDLITAFGERRSSGIGMKVLRALKIVS